MLYTSTKEFKYPCLHIPGLIWNFTSLKENKVKPFQEYVDSCEASLMHNDLKGAIYNGQKAALYYGAPGLILYFKVKLAQIRKE